jgi:hypothetical protein
VNKKQRLLSAVRFQGVDRLPTSFRATKPLARRLMGHFGIDESLGLAGRRELLGRIGADFWSTGSKIGYNSTFVPYYTGPRPSAPYIEDGSKFYTLGIGVARGRVEAYDFEYPVYIDPPLAKAESASDIAGGTLMSRLELFDFDVMVNRLTHARQTAPGAGSTDPLSYDSLREAGEDLMCMGMFNSPFMICCYLRGMEQFLIDLASDRALAERIIGVVGDFCVEFNRRELASFGPRAEFYAMWDDVAGQDGLLFSPRLFERYFLPIYRRLIEGSKRFGLLFNWHCCGSVHQALPAMIDAGIDVFDVVQTSARNMDLANLHRLYGNDVCFHGAVDVQKLLVYGSPAQVKEEVRRIVDLWGTRGGMIVAPSHEAVPETPIENILAVYEQIHVL